MKKIITATALLFAATGAFANEFDGVSPDAWLKQATVQQTAPAPSAAAGEVRVSEQNSKAVQP